MTNVWLYDPPKGWRTKRLKYLVRFGGGGTPDKGNPEYWDGGIPWVSPKDMKAVRIDETEDHITKVGLEASAAKLVPPGSLLVVVRSGILQHSIPVAINRVPVSLNQDLRSLTLDPELDARFLLFLIKGHERQLLSIWSKEGTTVESLETGLIGNTKIPLPKTDLQAEIADYLDEETGRLDALLAEKERVLNVVNEKRRAFVTRVVTAGLNPRVEMRDSGIPWLGHIPAHWETERSKWLFTERDQRGEPDLPLLEVSISRGVIPREFSDERIEATAADFNTYKVARTGDIVFNKMRMWQGAVGVAPCDGLTSPDYTVATPNGPLDAAYTCELFRTGLFSAECARHSHGIVWDRLRLYWEGFQEIRVPIPPANEQRTIVAFVVAERAKLDALEAGARRTIALLKERRTALIAAAVTGHVCIPTVA